MKFSFVRKIALKDSFRIQLIIIKPEFQTFIQDEVSFKGFSVSRLLFGGWEVGTCLKWSRKKFGLFNPFVLNAPFLCPLETVRFSDFFRGQRKGLQETNGLRQKSRIFVVFEAVEIKLRDHRCRCAVVQTCLQYDKP